MKKTYSISCMSTFECDNTAGLICPTTLNQCNCPLNSSTRFCDCPNGYYFDYIKANCSKFHQMSLIYTLFTILQE